MTTQPTPPKVGLRARLKQVEQERNRATFEANNGTIVVAALAWKLGLINRDAIKAVVDEYMAIMYAKVTEAKKEPSTQITEGFIDAKLMAKINRFTEGGAEEGDEGWTDDSSV